MTEDLRLGSRIIPLNCLKLEEAMRSKTSTRIEQWFELESSTETMKPVGMPKALVSGAKRNPGILLEISFASPDVLDDSEDDLDEIDEAVGDLKASFSKRASIKIRNQLKQELSAEEKKIEEPTLEPGIVDFACVVGARDIGDQKADDGARGWVNSTPDCVVLEQFPPHDEFHFKNGRHSALPNKVEWFCFPEGAKLWRGTTPPNSVEMNLKRFSASTPPNVATSVALFDACLGCTTSFSWFVFASNSEEYGSETSKTYGAVIRFYVPAPVGIDPTQDDFAQTLMLGSNGDKADATERKRLWVPLGICLTSNLPIVGILEAILLRICEALAAKCTASIAGLSSVIHDDLANLIVKFQKPIAGVVNCSIPFLSGERLHVALPPRKGLPPLPHGNAVSSVCRLLGADGLVFLLSALLTECKILLHSDDIANVCMVAEVSTALMYPFQWLLPYIPVLPPGMLEFIEAPLSYLLGVASCNLKHLDPSALEDVVVIDLDRDYSSNDAFNGQRSQIKTKAPTPLPASVASNVSKAVYRLLRAEEELDDFGKGNIHNVRAFARMEPESLAERDFRLAIAFEVSGLVRGLHESLVYAASSSHPVFNGDKFLQTAPVMFEEQRGTATSSTQGSGESGTQRVVSPRSRRFMSLFVKCQHFHQFLDTLEHEHLSVFRDVSNAIKAKSFRRDGTLTGKLAALDSETPIAKITKKLEKLEDKIPTYRVARHSTKDDEHDVDETISNEIVGSSRFPVDLLQQILVAEDPNDEQSGSGEGVKQISLQYLVELEKNPWRYHPVLNIDELDGNSESRLAVPEKVKLRDAIGERRYRAWKIAQTRDLGDEVSVFSEDESRVPSVSLDIKSLITSATLDIPRSSSDDEKYEQQTEEEAQHRLVTNAKDRDVLRRCLERARVSGEGVAESLADRGRDFVSEAEGALQNPSARRFLLAILSKRSPLDGAQTDESSKRRRLGHTPSASKLGIDAFEVLVRLGYAMLDACMETHDYDSAYALLKFTAGLYAAIGDSDGESSIVYLTGRIGLHPVYADLGVWERVKRSHLVARREVRQDGTLDEVDKESDEYEAAVATLYEMVGYGIPSEELARFASRISEHNKWFKSDRGQALLVLSRRLCVRREHGEGSAQSGKPKSDLELMSSTVPFKQVNTKEKEQQCKVSTYDDLAVDESVWIDTGWCHPAAKSSRRLSVSENATTARRPGTQNLLNMLEEQKLPLMTRGTNRMKRTAVTTMAYLGSSMVATGGLDGGVFLARKVRKVSDETRDDIDNLGVLGLHLDWGSSGSRYSGGAAATAMDGEYGVGAVSCLAATRGLYQTYQTLGVNASSTKDSTGPADAEDLLQALDGCRVIAGTTCGDLRVWAVKDVLSAVFYARSSEGTVSSGFGASRRKGVTDFAAGSSLTRLKFSLRGRALSGHRGGVSCVDVPSNVYRPDSIVSGGADGLIKLWSLRAPGGVGRTDTNTPSRLLSSPASESPHMRAARNGDALSILSGHGGRILCVKTAWHGDRLLSGGADRIVRIWDIAGSGGRCLSSLSGHFGWVTAVRYWGPSTIISASTDRSIALWDARVRNSPLFTLRHHYASVSDLIVGSRTDPIMLSSAMDGTVAAWDFRHLSGSAEKSRPTSSSPQDSGKNNAKYCQVVRDPVAQLYMRDFVSKRRHIYGPVLLSKATRRDHGQTVYCVGSDATLREWDVQTGQVVSDHVTGHCDTISSFCSLQGDRLLDTQLEGTGQERATGTITASWDGTVRFRSLCRRKKP
jgi:WD40 repeat protein